MNIGTHIIPSALLAATLLAAPAFANAGEPQDGTTLKPVRAVAHAPQKIFRGHQAAQLLALETGVRARDVKMIEINIARKTRYQFRRQQETEQRFASALGPARFSAWSSGRPIQLYSPAVIQEANRMAGIAPDRRGAVDTSVAVNP